jgi:3-phenylpropionate/cinnamic acid dioxygenase small subunit
VNAEARPTDSALVDFVYHEARLIDEKRFEEWYELFTDDARYWIPLTRGQPNGETYTSLSYEDKLLLRIRIERLRQPNAFSQEQPSFCQHILQHPSVESASPEANLYVTRTPFMYVETQLDEQLVLAGICRHHLTCVNGLLRIRLKKVELVNCDAAFRSIQLFP